MKTEKAQFSAGCFWGIQAAFDEVNGVVSTLVGYSGGHTKNPTYEQVCTGKTGHAESVLVEFDSKKISYSDLLRLFWRIHDPTQLNRQGPDVGHQYRSVIFFFSNDQKKEADDSKRALEKSGAFSKPIVTEILPASDFWNAEEYHQKYLQKNKSAVC